MDTGKLIAAESQKKFSIAKYDAKSNYYASLLASILIGMAVFLFILTPTEKLLMKITVITLFGLFTFGWILRTIISYDYWKKTTRIKIYENGFVPKKLAGKKEKKLDLILWNSVNSYEKLKAEIGEWSYKIYYDGNKYWIHSDLFHKKDKKLVYDFIREKARSKL